MKDLISLKDLSKENILEIFKLAKDVKKNRGKEGLPLKCKTVALVFAKPSNRTRVSFEVGIFELGGYPLYLGPYEIRLGERESIKDAAQVFSRYVDAIVIRTFAHEDVEQLAKHADIPVINGLSDFAHPCQILADMFTIEEKIGLGGKKIVYVGDGNNIVNSWMFAAARMGLHFVVSTPARYMPDAKLLQECSIEAKENGGLIEYIEEPHRAAANADVIYTDVWASMGQEEEKEKRKKDFKDYQVNSALISLAKKDCLFMHCLPAYRGLEVTDEVIDSKNSVVFDEAENRLHVQKAVLMMLMK
ncbi:ornithine carbamoyltransferase [bacterium]|nr:ornithine carbamoyltransferase [bacterium]